VVFKRLQNFRAGRLVVAAGEGHMLLRSDAKEIVQTDFFGPPLLAASKRRQDLGLLGLVETLKIAPLRYRNWIRLLAGRCVRFEVTSAGLDVH